MHAPDVVVTMATATSGGRSGRGGVSQSRLRFAEICKLTCKVNREEMCEISISMFKAQAYECKFYGQDKVNCIRRYLYTILK